MTLHARSLILATSLVTMSPGTADSKAASGMNTGDTNATLPAVPPGATSNHTPGATGRTIVPGPNSTAAGAAPGSQTQKTGTVSSGGSK
jgi:hypothetical protein